IKRVEELGARISMDGKGRWMDNVFIERLWRSVKYEEIYQREHATIPRLEVGLAQWFEHYNTWRPHEALAYDTPQQAYAGMVKLPPTPPRMPLALAA
ncbi:integrase core domain-containing protein, partial [Verrucomicrobium sp. BvORR034]|uniref:integrase core domain-containing protein n=1 Tax=Verrucomicrobium sp. BvORR034 TaxID=1396418 RepID=UPI002241050D